MDNAGQPGQATRMVPPWRIGVDVGGTFTDLVMVDAQGALMIVKTPSVPTNPGEGVLDAVRKAAANLAMPVEGFLAQCRLFVHGSTVATNTVLEGKGAKVGLLTTHGFRDSLEIRRGIRDNPWDHRKPFPPVLVPRYLRLPVRGRLDSEGAEVAPIAVADAVAAGEIFTCEGVEAVAICLFNAYADGRHEDEAARALAESWSGEWVSRSSAIAPTIGEYERSSTAVMNAYVAPRVVTYLRDLAKELQRLGLPGALLMSQSNGGVVSVDQIADRPVNLVLSGPAAGVGAMTLAANALGDDNLISMEIGGTSCDVALIERGPGGDERCARNRRLSSRRAFRRDPYRRRGGGGTIAGVDGAGMLFAGPKGAGARPGPACYGHGGTEPTVTDAQLVLGRLAPGAYAGGSVTLNRERAREAIRTRVAEPLGISIEDAASGIIRLVEQHLLHAVERISVQRGFNPAGFTLVPAGGAGPLHGPSVAAMLGARRVYVPRQGRRLSAPWGFCNRMSGRITSRSSCAISTGMPPGPRRLQWPRRTASHSCAPAQPRRSPGKALPVIQAAYRRALDLRSIAASNRIFAWNCPMARLSIRPWCAGSSKRNMPASSAISSPAAPSRSPACAWPVSASCRRSKQHRRRRVTRRRIGAKPAGSGSPIGWRDTAIYDGADLAPGQSIAGPAIVTEQTMTAIARAGDTLSVDSAGNFIIDLAERGSQT